MDYIHPAEKIMAEYGIRNGLILEDRIFPEDIRQIAAGDGLLGRDIQPLKKGKTEDETLLNLVYARNTTAQHLARNNDMPAFTRKGRFQYLQQPYIVKFEIHMPGVEGLKKLKRAIRTKEYAWNLSVYEAHAQQQAELIFQADVEQKTEPGMPNKPVEYYFYSEDAEHTEGWSPLWTQLRWFTETYPVDQEIDSEEYTQEFLKCLLEL